MRGYTSLFSHILGSHPEIKGYTEMHQSYRSNLGLIKLRYKLKLTTKSIETPRYLYDKLLHSDYKVSKQILKKHNVYPIIMAREPEKTMKSIRNMGENLTKVVSWYKDDEKVADYYIQRLQILEKIARRAKGNVPFIEGRQLIDRTDETLAFITDYLRLQSPLQKEYQTFDLTGSIGMGDPSKHIKQGQIVKKRSNYDEILIDPEHLNRAKLQYHTTVIFLQSICTTI